MFIISYPDKHKSIQRFINDTVTLQIHKDDGDERDLPYIKDGGLSDRYIFYQLHFHWGSNNRIGSEHRIANKRYTHLISSLFFCFLFLYLFDERYPAELHIVHYGQKYDNFTEASKHPDGLAVLAVLIEVNKFLFKSADGAKVYLLHSFEITDGKER